MLKLVVMPILCFTHSHLNQSEYSMTYFGKVSKIYVISFAISLNSGSLLTGSLLRTFRDWPQPRIRDERDRIT